MNEVVPQEAVEQAPVAAPVAPHAAEPVSAVEPVAAPIQGAGAPQQPSESDIREEMFNQREIMDRINSVVREDKVATLAGAGITQDVIDAWKVQHGPIEALTINGQIYVYRGIRRLELEKIQEDTANAKGTLREDMIAERCTLYPELSRVNFPHGSAGLPTTISERVTGLSGFEFEEEIPVRL